MSRYQTNYKIPNGWNEAVAIAASQPNFTRVGTSRAGEILPGIPNDRNLGRCLQNILIRLNERLGYEYAKDASFMLCMTGYLPSPKGVPHLHSAKEAPGAVATYALRLVESLTYKLVQQSKDLDYPSMSIPSKSGCGFPYMRSGQDGLLIRRAYIESFQNNLDEIADLLANRKFSTLMQATGRYLPMFPVYTVNWRNQPERAKELEFSGQQISHVSFKNREVYDCEYNKCVQRYSIPWSNINRSMRARAINAASSTYNMLFQANIQRFRKAILSYPLWHITSVDESHKRACDVFPTGCTHTYDFSQMDHSMTSDMWSCYIRGWKRAGASDAFINLANCVRYGPFLVTEDDPSRARNPRPMRLVGDPTNADDPGNDLGTRSGEADTDCVNKISGTSVYFAAAIAAGLVEGLTLETDPDIAADEFFNSVARCVAPPGSRFIFEGNCGDDHAIRFNSSADAKRYDEALAKLSPYWDVTVESDSQLLGWELSDDGHAYPYLGRSISNFLCPERFWDDRMRRDFFMLGVSARDEHYSLNPLWQRVYRPTMNECCIEVFGITPFEAAAVSPPALPAEPINAAELELLYNPDAVSYKYEVGSDVRSSYVDDLKLFYTLDPEQVEKLQL